jgi:hypothetical protein
MAVGTVAATGVVREIYLDRRVCTISPDRIEVHPARSLVWLPLLTLIIGLSVFPAVFFMGDSLSVWLRMLITLAAVIVIPVSGVGLVYSIAGAHIVVDRAKQSIVLQQGYLGMGVGTLELVPFWKIDRVRVQELTPHDERGHQDDFAQYEVTIVKLSAKEVPVGTVTVARADAKDGLARAREIADLIGDMSGAKVQVTRPRSAAARQA